MVTSLANGNGYQHFEQTCHMTRANLGIAVHGILLKALFLFERQRQQIPSQNNT